MSKPRTKPYRPSNATEFDVFYSRQCRHCTQDDPASQTVCHIIGHAMMRWPEAPPEWIVDPRRGPICTAYTEDEADPAPCPDTPRML